MNKEVTECKCTTETCYLCIDNLTPKKMELYERVSLFIFTAFELVLQYSPYLRDVIQDILDNID